MEIMHGPEHPVHVISFPLQSKPQSSVLEQHFPVILLISRLLKGPANRSSAVEKLLGYFQKNMFVVNQSRAI
jgi:hypothetical protein